MNPILKIEHFCFSYPGTEKTALCEIDLSIEEGSFTVLCGKSGCGKSTLLRHFKSVLAPHGKTDGIILYDGEPLSKVSERRQAAEIGYVLQNPDNQIVTDKVWHELAFGLESLGYPDDVIRIRVAEMANYFGIQNWFLRDVEELSGGQKQLLNLASVMAMHPRLLILDEPTSQLDPIAAADFLETVRRINRDIGTTVILTEHRLQEVIPAADHVIVMDEGRIFTQGSSREIAERLKEASHDMFLSMPVPMQIYADTDSKLSCPLTVSEGRKWIRAYMGEEKRKEGEQIADGNSSGKEKDERAIEMKDVWFRYEADGDDVIKDLSLSVRAGEFYAIVGGNGTGKSTTISLLSRVRVPYRGSIKLFGKNLKRYKDEELYRGTIGVLPQNPQSIFLKKTVEEDIYSAIGGRKERNSPEYSSSMKKSEAVLGMAKLTGLTQLFARHPYDLSGGEQQRLALCKVLLQKPRILIMDEPTKGLDGAYKKELGSILKKLQSHGVTIVMISHDVEFVAEYADRCALFFQGAVVSEAETHRFFAGNSFYTTAANRMAREYFPQAITGKEVCECLSRTKPTAF